MISVSVQVIPHHGRLMHHREGTPSDVKASHVEKRVADTEVPKPKICCSARLLLVIMWCLAFFSISYNKLGISMAFVCMAKPEGGSRSTGKHEKKEEFDWSSSLIGYFASAAFYGYVISPTIAGFLSFKFGGKVVMVSGMFGTGASWILTPELTRLNNYLFIPVRVLSGFFAGLLFPAFFDMMSHWALPEERPMMIGGALTGVPIACILNFPITSFICNYFGWVWIFYIIGTWMVLSSVLTFFITFDYPKQCPFISEKERLYIEKGIKHHESHKIPWKAITKSLPIYAYIVMHFCVNYVYISVSFSLPLLMKEIYRVSMTNNAFLSAAPFVAVLFTRIFLTFCFEKIRKRLKLSKNTLRKFFVLTGASVFSISMLTITFLSVVNPYYVLACFVVAMTSVEFCLTGGYLSSIIDLCPSYANIISGIANTIGNSAGLICPVVTGCLTIKGTKDEWNIVFYITAFVLAASAIFYLIFGRNNLQPWAVPLRPSLSRNGSASE